MGAHRNDPARGLLAGLLATGLAISALMIARSQALGDQIELYARGWLLAAEGYWVPFGNMTSAGGYEAGGLTALVVGLPLFAWMDHRAPILLILACHLVAYLLLDRVVGRATGSRGRLVLAVVYWLAPWRIYFSGFLWNPNYLFLTGAVHLFSCHAQRERPSFFHSTLLVALTGLSFQLHPSVLVLVISAAALWWRGYWKPHWGGVALGAAVTLGAIVPWALEAMARPEILPGGDDDHFFGRGLLYGYPFLKGLLYWFRHASLWCSSKWMTNFDFTPALGADADAVLGPIFFVLTRVIGPATVVVPLLAGAWVWRRRRALLRVPVERRTSRLWLHGYALWCFAAAALTYAIAPTTVMMWQGLVILHAAVLPLVLGWTALERTRHRVWARRGLAAWLALSLVLLIGMATGSSMYRRGGRGTAWFAFTTEHPMLTDLGLTRCCPIVVDPVRAVEDLDYQLDRLRPPP